MDFNGPSCPPRRRDNYDRTYFNEAPNGKIDLLTMLLQFISSLINYHQFDLPETNQHFMVNLNLIKLCQTEETNGCIFVVSLCVIHDNNVIYI